MRTTMFEPTTAATVSEPTETPGKSLLGDAGRRFMSIEITNGQTCVPEWSPLSTHVQLQHRDLLERAVRGGSPRQPYAGYSRSFVPEYEDVRTMDVERMSCGVVR